MTVAELQTALTRPGAGDALTHATLTTVATGTGDTVKVTLAQPEVLAARSGLSREEYALARCIRSEGYGGDPVGRAAAAVAIGQAIRNGAALSHKSIEAKLTYSLFPEARGLYGEQSGRYAATTLDPTVWTGEVARAVLAGGLPDLARGGHKFVDPKVFAGGTQAGRKLSRFVEVMTSWLLGDEALVWRGDIPTIDPFHLVVLGKASAGTTKAMRRENLDRLVAVYEEGVKGNHAPAPGDPDDIGPGWVVGGAVLLLAGGLALMGQSLRWW